MAHVHRIGDPENKSETKAIRALAEVLPDDYLIFHNFELTTGRGLPYEYDMAIVSDFAMWHVEVKGYRNENVKLKSETMKTQWVPGVNNMGSYGRWAFVEFGDVYEMDKEFKVLIDRVIEVGANGNT